MKDVGVDDQVSTSGDRERYVPRRRTTYDAGEAP